MMPSRKFFGRWLFYALLIFIGSLWGSTATLDGVARDCQKQTFFRVDKVRFECMEWKETPFAPIPH
jgi:hypothetical protein